MRTLFLLFLASLLVLPSRGAHADLATARSHQLTLRAAPVEQLLAGGGQRVSFWGFNDHVPGPPLRFRKGDKQKSAPWP